MTDRRIFAILVASLSATLVLCVAGVIFLLATSNPVDDILKQAITGLITGLLGLFARQPASSDVQHVQVVNAPADPVPTTDLEPKPAARTRKRT